MSAESALRCPSAQPTTDDAQVLGVVTGAAGTPRIAYLNARLPAVALAGATGGLPATRVLRFAARCESSQCVHYDGNACRLASRIVAGLDPVVDALPPCTIRRTCRWHAQEGRAACLRCPQVVTAPAPGSEGRLADVAGLPA